MINGITYTEVEIQSAVPHLDTAQFSKLQEALTVLCWYFFDLTEITILKKENISSILLAKIYENNFHYQFLAKVCSTKLKQFV